jgi:hypothetical protein
VLCDWKRRYAGLGEAHHTEEFGYVDAADGMGFYTLTGQVAADPSRLVWRTSLSFQLSGIPVDVGSLRELCDAVGTESQPYFRPRREDLVRIGRLHSEESVVLDKVGLIAMDSDLGSKEQEWAVGVIAKNPWWRKARGGLPDEWPDMIVNQELLICSLSSWHPIDEPKATYRLWSCDSAWTSDALVVRAVADWEDVGIASAGEPRNLLSG